VSAVVGDARRAAPGGEQELADNLGELVAKLGRRIEPRGDGHGRLEEFVIEELDRDGVAGNASPGQPQVFQVRQPRRWLPI
jgi:hypothetical protein